MVVTDKGERMRMKNIIKKTCLLLFVCLFIVGNMNPSTAFAQETKAFHYVALGDSITVGFEPGMNLNTVPYGFVERIYEQALYNGRADYANYGVGGMTSTGLINYLQAMKDGKAVTTEEIQPKLVQIDPRLEERIKQMNTVQSKIKEADLITVTIGGNDIRDLPEVYKQKTKTEFEEIVKTRLGQIDQNVRASLAILFELNPKATIVLADQYQPYPHIANMTDKVLFDTLNEMRLQYHSEFQKIVKEYQTESKKLLLAPVGEAFVGNEILYTHILRKVPDIHPNQNGYEAIARVIAETVWGEYKQPSFTDPIAIIVGGAELDIKDKPVLINGRTYLPIREYAEQLGAKVEWEGKTKSAKISYEDRLATFTSQAVLRTEDVATSKFDGNILLYNSKTYVSLRAVAEELGFDVIYIAKSKTAYINK